MNVDDRDALIAQLRAEQARLAAALRELGASETDAGERQRGQDVLHFLAEAGAVLASSLDLETTLQSVVDLIVPRLADWCVVDIVAPDGQIRRLAMQHVNPAKRPLLAELEQRYPHALDAPSGPARVLRTGEPEFYPQLPPAAVEAAAVDQHHLALLRALDMHSYLCVPLIARGRALGAISFIFAGESRRHYEPADLTLADLLARRVAIAVDNARLYHEAQVARAQLSRQADRLAVLAEASRVFAEARLEPQAIFDAVAREVALRVGDVCIIRLLSEDGRWLLPAAVFDPDPEALAYTVALLHSTRHGVDEGLNGVAVRTGDTQLVAEASIEMLRPLVKPEYLPQIERFGTFSLLIVPLRARGRVLGTIGLSRSTPGRPYTRDDQTLIADLAERAALAIESARLLLQARAAEQRYRSLFESAADAILVADARGRYTDANPAAETLLGYSRDELLQMQVADIIPLGPAWTAAEYERYLAERYWHGELELRRKDGSRVPVEATATVGGTPDEPVYLSTIRDMSSRRAAERLQRELMTMVTHDLKSPLTSIKGFAQLMQRRQAYSDAPVQAIVAQTTHLERLIDDLLDAARLEAGRVELRRQRVDLVSLATTTAEHAQAASQAHAVRVAAPDTPIWGWWDPDRVAQVLRNLLSNAVKYSNGGEVVVAVTPPSDHSGEATVAVTDHGIGIPPDALPYIFERFYRVAGPDSGPAGLGLGLSISRALVEAHGGRIGVDSTPGTGSTFWFTLPVGT